MFNCTECKEPPYAERHVRWCERSENESRKKTFVFLLLDCLGALPLLYPAAPPSVFDYCILKYTAPAVALMREYVVEIDTIGEGNGYSLQS